MIRLNVDGTIVMDEREAPGWNRWFMPTSSPWTVRREGMYWIYDLMVSNKWALSVMARPPVEQGLAMRLEWNAHVTRLRLQDTLFVREDKDLALCKHDDGTWSLMLRRPATAAQRWASMTDDERRACSGLSPAGLRAAESGARCGQPDGDEERKMGSVWNGRMQSQLDELQAARDAWLAEVNPPLIDLTGDLMAVLGRAKEGGGARALLDWLRDNADRVRDVLEPFDSGVRETRP